MRKRVVIAICGGLRPDRVDPLRTPAIWRLRQSGCWFANARTTFPSHARVAAASMVTGSCPGGHGLLANAFYDPTVFPDRAIDTASESDLAELCRLRGRLLSRLTLAERIARAGLRYAVVSTAPAGTTAILRAGARHGASYAWAPQMSARSPGTAATARLRPSPVYRHDESHAAMVAHATGMFVEHALDEFDADLAVFWSDEPDAADAARGLPGATASEAERAADDAVRRIGEWRHAAGEEGTTQIVVASGHGHASGSRRVDLRAVLGAAGWRIADRCPAPGDLFLVPGATTLVYGPRAGSREAHALVSWLADQEWFGAAFLGGNVPGRAGLAELGLSHPRGPDLAFTLRQDLGAGHAALAHEGPQPPGFSIHGGLHPEEMASLLLLEGGAFRRSARPVSHAGICDIAPTVAAVLGLDADGMDGRTLDEALAWRPADPPDTAHEALAPIASFARARLLRTCLDGRWYIDGLVEA